MTRHHPNVQLRVQGPDNDGTMDITVMYCDISVEAVCMMLYVTWCNMYFNFMRCAGAHCDVMIYSCNQLLHWKCTAAHFFQLPVLHCDCILYTHVNSTSHRLILPDRASLNLLTLKPQGAVFLSMVFPFTYQVGVIKNPLKHPSDPQLPAPKIHPES